MQPCSQSGSRPVRDQVNDPVLLQVHKDGAVGAPFARGPIIVTARRRGRDVRPPGHKPGGARGKELEQFRQEVERLRAGRKAGSSPFPEPLRAFVVRSTWRTRSRRTDMLKAVVERLGVSESTLPRRGGGGRRPAARRGRAVSRGRSRCCPWWYTHRSSMRPPSVATTFAGRVAAGLESVEGLGLEETALLLRRLAC